MTNLSQLNSFLSLAISELNKSHHNDGRKWFVNHYVQGTETRSEITLGHGKMAEVVTSIKTGTLHGNDINPNWVDLYQLLADGLIKAAEKRGLI